MGQLVTIFLSHRQFLQCVKTNHFFLGLAPLFSPPVFFQTEKKPPCHSKIRNLWSDFRGCLTQQTGNNITSFSFVDHQLFHVLNTIKYMKTGEAQVYDRLIVKHFSSQSTSGFQKAKECKLRLLAKQTSDKTVNKNELFCQERNVEIKVSHSNCHIPEGHVWEHGKRTLVLQSLVSPQELHFYKDSNEKVSLK